MVHIFFLWLVQKPQPHHRRKNEDPAANAQPFLPQMLALSSTTTSVPVDTLRAHLLSLCDRTPLFGVNRGGRGSIEQDLQGLSVRISKAIEKVALNVAAALCRLDVLVSEVQSTNFESGCSSNPDLDGVATKVQALKEEISSAEANKVALLEAEAVVADNALETAQVKSYSENIDHFKEKLLTHRLSTCRTLVQWCATLWSLSMTKISS